MNSMSSHAFIKNRIWKVSCLTDLNALAQHEVSVLDPSPEQCTWYGTEGLEFLPFQVAVNSLQEHLLQTMTFNFQKYDRASVLRSK